MKETDIRKYAELMKELELTGLELTEGDKVVRLERNITVATQPLTTVASAPQKAEAEAENTDYISVKSPMVGVFYAAPAENSEPFVSLGDRIEKGKTLCIIEAMKLMNEINAETDGVISEICVQNGQVVEFGTELFRIRR